MSYSILSADVPPYQSPVLRGSEHLAVLEDVCTLYQRSGYKITSHSADSFVLTRPRSGVNLFVVLVLLAAPPLLLLYVILARNARDEVVCVRINSRGAVEETGDTLDAARAARRNSWIVTAIVLAIVGGFLILIVATILSNSTGRNSGVTNSSLGANANLSSSTGAFTDYEAPPPGSSGKSKRGKAKAAEFDDPYGAPYGPSDDSIPLPAEIKAPPPDYFPTPIIGAPDVAAPADVEPVVTIPPSSASPKIAKPETRKEVSSTVVKLVNDGDVFFLSRAAAGKVYSKNEVDGPAQLIYRPEPVRTGESVGSSGVVRLEAVCRADGTVTDIRVIKGLPNELTWAAVQAARGITFTPSTKDGVAVPMLLRITYNFKAN